MKNIMIGADLAKNVLQLHGASMTGEVLGRVTHHVNILEMNGHSYRLAQSRARKAG